MEKTIHIEITTDQLKKKLIELFKKSGNEHYELLANTIIGNLCYTQVGLQQLYHAFSGHEELIDFLPGDEVLVKFKDIYDWKFDRELSKAAGLINDDGVLKAKIIGINKYHIDNIEISYILIENKNTDSSIFTQPIKSTKLFRDEKCKIRNNIADLL